MRYVAALITLVTVLSAETIDRLAITVGYTVITELQIDEDLRVAALMNSQPISRDLESRRAAADRLVEQLLIQHEIQLSRYPTPTAEEVTTLYNRVAETLGGAERLKALLTQFSVSEETLRDHLQAQLEALRFIEFRFRPDITISDSEVEAAYRDQVNTLSVANPKAKLPPLDASEKAKLTEVLLEERTDAALNSWLAESRKQVNILYIDSALQ